MYDLKTKLKKFPCNIHTSMAQKKKHGFSHSTRFPAPAASFSLENELLAKPIQSDKAFQF